MKEHEKLRYFIMGMIVFMTLMAIGNAFNFLPNSVYWSVIIDTEPTRAGTFGGITHFFANIATIVAPTLTGYLVATNGYASMFTAAVVAVVIGMVAMIFVKPGQSTHVSKVTVEKNLTRIGRGKK